MQRGDERQLDRGGAVVRQVAQHFGVPLVDLRLTTIEPVDLRGAIYADDVQGRTKIYESLVKGDNTLTAGTPESFNVLIKEIQSLGLDIKLNKRDAIGFGVSAS